MATKPHREEKAGTWQPARFVLRERTRSDHDLVDTAFSRFDLSDTDGYARFLTAQYLAHREVESWLAMANLPAAFRLADRTPLIAADLHDLGRSVPAQGLPAPMPASSSFAACLGVLYCIAGSSFGARVLIQRLPAGAPARFLAQPLPAGFWQRVVDTFDMVSQQNGLGATIAAAKRTFSLFSSSAERAAEGGAERAAEG